MDKFKEGYEKLSGSGRLKITSYNDTEIFGDITVNDGEMVYPLFPTTQTGRYMLTELK